MQQESSVLDGDGVGGFDGWPYRGCKTKPCYARAGLFFREPTLRGQGRSNSGDRSRRLMPRTLPIPRSIMPGPTPCRRGALRHVLETPRQCWPPARFRPPPMAISLPRARRHARLMPISPPLSAPPSFLGQKYAHHMPISTTRHYQTISTREFSRHTAAASTSQ